MQNNDFVIWKEILGDAPTTHLRLVVGPECISNQNSQFLLFKIDERTSQTYILGSSIIIPLPEQTFDNSLYKNLTSFCLPKYELPLSETEFIKARRLLKEAKDFLEKAFNISEIEG